MRARKLPGDTGRVSDCSRDDVRKSRLALFLALSAIGLIASLVPATEHVFASTGPPVEVLDVPWPGSGVQQSLGNHAFELHTARVWVTARPGAGEVRIDAALVVGPDSRPIRQFSFDAQPTTGPYRPTTLQLATGEIPREQDIRLQLSVAPDARDPVSIGVAAADGGFARPTLNGVPAHVGGPLAVLVMSIIRFGGLPTDAGVGGLLSAGVMIGSMVLFTWIAALPLTLAVAFLYRRVRVLAYVCGAVLGPATIFGALIGGLFGPIGIVAYALVFSAPRLDCPRHHGPDSARPHERTAGRERLEQPCRCSFQPCEICVR